MRRHNFPIMRKTTDDYQLGLEVGGDREPGVMICFEGLDGAGKTATAREVTRRLKAAGEAAVYVDKSNPDFVHPFVQRHMAALRRVIWENENADPTEALGFEHWVHLLAAWYDVVDRCRVRPLLEGGYTVIIDGWHYKYLARFLHKRFPPAEHVRACFGALRRPDFVVLLDVDPAIAAARRTQLRPTETGNLDGFSGQTRENFIAYQTLVSRALTAVLAHESTVTIRVGTNSLMAVADEVVLELACRRAIRWLPRRAAARLMTEDTADRAQRRASSAGGSERPRDTDT